MSHAYFTSTTNQHNDWVYLSYQCCNLTYALLLATASDKMIMGMRKETKQGRAIHLYYERDYDCFAVTDQPFVFLGYPYYLV